MIGEQYFFKNNSELNMRAIVVDSFQKKFKSVDSVYVIDGDNAHHLINVVRVKTTEKILIFDGNGQTFECKIEKVSKKDITVVVTNVVVETSKHMIDILVSPPKKDAFSEIIKNATELGIRNLFLLESQFAQINEQTMLKKERIDRLIESAMQQSNNPFFLTVHSEFKKIHKDKSTLLESFFDSYKYIFYFSSQTHMQSNGLGYQFSQDDKVLLIIGPEGGFSNEEESVLSRHKNVKTLHLPSYILRSENAVLACAGYTLSFLVNSK